MNIENISTMSAALLEDAAQSLRKDFMNLPEDSVVMKLQLERTIQEIRVEQARRKEGKIEAQSLMYFGDFPLAYLVKQYKNIDLLAKNGLRPENMIFLHGPLGYGKTHLAAYTAQRIGLPFRMLNPNMISFADFEGGPVAIGVQTGACDYVSAEQIVGALDKAKPGSLVFLFGLYEETGLELFDKRIDRKISVGPMSEDARRAWFDHVGLTEGQKKICLEATLYKGSREVERIIQRFLRESVLDSL